MVDKLDELKAPDKNAGPYDVGGKSHRAVIKSRVDGYKKDPHPPLMPGREQHKKQMRAFLNMSKNKVDESEQLDEIKAPSFGAGWYTHTYPDKNGWSVHQGSGTAGGLWAAKHKEHGTKIFKTQKGAEAHIAKHTQAPKQITGKTMKESLTNLVTSGKPAGFVKDIIARLSEKTEAAIEAHKSRLYENGIVQEFRDPAEKEANAKPGDSEDKRKPRKKDAKALDDKEFAKMRAEDIELDEEQVDEAGNPFAPKWHTQFIGKDADKLSKMQKDREDAAADYEDKRYNGSDMTRGTGNKDSETNQAFLKRERLKREITKKTGMTARDQASTRKYEKPSLK